MVSEGDIERREVCAALLERDRVFSDLPAYTKWILELRPIRFKPQSNEVFVNHLVDLWKKAHRLNEELSQVNLLEATRTNANSAVTDLSNKTEILIQLTIELEQARIMMKTDLTAYVKAIQSSSGRNQAEVYANHLALTVLDPQDRATLKSAYWENRDGDKAIGSNERRSRSEISLLEQRSVAMFLTRNRWEIGMEVLGAAEVAREDYDSPKIATGAEGQPAASGNKRSGTDAGGVCQGTDPRPRQA